MGERALWATVMNDALNYLRDPITRERVMQSPYYVRSIYLERLYAKQQSIEFFKGKGNFKLACNVLDLDADRVQNIIRRKHDKINW